MTTAAIKVLPMPVGKHTRVLQDNAFCTMAYWYSLMGRCEGYTQYLQ
jgi:hypothetical protein